MKSRKSNLQRAKEKRSASQGEAFDSWRRSIWRPKQRNAWALEEKPTPKSKTREAAGWRISGTKGRARILEETPPKRETRRAKRRGGAGRDERRGEARGYGKATAEYGGGGGAAAGERDGRGARRGDNAGNADGRGKRRGCGTGDGVGGSRAAGDGERGGGSGGAVGRGVGTERDGGVPAVGRKLYGGELRVNDAISGYDKPNRIIGQGEKYGI